jgi:hypothetical protein
MIEKVKALLAKWQVKAAIVGGVFVVGSVFGTCSFEPGPSAEAPEAVEAEESSDTTAVTTETVTGTATETTTETTTGTTTGTTAE